MNARLLVLLLGLMLGHSAQATDLIEQAGSWFGKLREQAASAVQGTGTTADVVPATQAASAPTTIVVGRKKVKLRSQVIDAQCDRLVEPFELNLNFMELAALAATGAVQSVPELLMRPGEQQVSASKHRISRAVREKALQINWLPMDLEERYGRYIHDQAVTAGDLIERDSSLGKRLYPKADQLLAVLLEGVEQSHPYTFELHIRKSSEDNAIALPGGIVYLDAGLLRSENPSKARFALAHELSHVLRRHETRIAQARLIDAVSISGSMNDLYALLKNPSGVSLQLLKSAAVGHKVFQKHYIDQELQADACGVRLLDSALPDNNDVAAAIASFIASLPADEAKAGGPAKGQDPRLAEVADLMSQVSSPIDRHPTSAERKGNLQRMRNAAQGLPEDPPTVATQ